MNTISHFYRSLDPEADGLEDCLDQIPHKEEAIGQYQLKVHSMKSSAALIGAVPISGMAKLLEDAAKGRQLETIRHLTPVFLEAWRGYREKLKGLLKEEKETAKADDQVILSYLQTLKAAMEDMDIDTADETMHQLRRYPYPEDVQNLMDRLDAAVTNLDDRQTSHLTETLINLIRARNPALPASGHTSHETEVRK